MPIGAQVFAKDGTVRIVTGNNSVNYQGIMNRKYVEFNIKYS